mgnify:CR=1 FL=1
MLRIIVSIKMGGNVSRSVGYIFDSFRANIVDEYIRSYLRARDSDTAVLVQILDDTTDLRGNFSY